MLLFTNITRRLKRCAKDAQLGRAKNSSPFNLALWVKVKNMKFQNPEVEKTFNTYSSKIKKQLLSVRRLIFEIAHKTNEVGNIEETLKWDNPSYITSKPKSGTTIRLSSVRGSNSEYAISVHCQTTLIAEFKEKYPELTYEGNRSIILNLNEKLPSYEIEEFIFLALTYHYRKKQGIGI